MRHTVNTKTEFDNARGYTLVEVAIVIMIVGILLAPALSLYNRWMDRQEVEETELSISRVETSIANFLSMYGRYPCPAAMDAQPGDVDYGYEDCTATAPGVRTAVSFNTALASAGNQSILIGSLPFRKLNLQEQNSYDAYGNRFSYAVTDILTDATTFNLGEGGITIVDSTGANALEEPHTAHFAIVTHGENDDGAITRNGVMAGTCSGLLDQENCDYDETFMKSDIRNGYDDIIVQSTTRLINEWQYTSPTSEDVVLSNASMFGIGIEDSVELASASGLTVLESVANDAVIYVSGGAFFSNEICDYDDTACFEALAIAGQISESEGMDCVDGSGNPSFLVGVEDGGPVCENNIVFSCPAGEFFAGLNSDGELVCSGAPAPGCAAVPNQATSCGTSANLAAAADGGYSFIESGECYMLNTFSSGTASSQATVTDLQNYIDSLNAGARTPQACPSDNLVRDNFECHAGEWLSRDAPSMPQTSSDGSYTTGARTHELWNYMGSFPSNPDRTGQPEAETGGAGYSIGAARDANDCWCREDYRLVQSPCPTGSTGNQVQVQKYRCPQTRDSSSSWHTIYTDNTSYCTCAPYTDTTNRNCSAYYRVPGNAMSGQVTRTFNNTCDAGGNIVTDPTPTIDTSACICPVRADTVSENDCPFGTTNSWSHGGENYTGVASIDINTWNCPNGQGNPVSGAGDAGSWSTTNVPGPACVCDSSLTGTEILPCPTGYTGAGRQYLKEWDCSIPGWEPQADWDLISDSCTACTWKRPSTPPNQASSPNSSNEVSSGGCTCGQTGLCYEKAGSSLFDNYVGCQCQP